MKQKIIGIELEKVDRDRLVALEMSDELKEYFKIGQKPDWQKFLEYCLASEKNYKIAEKAVKKAMKEALPENVSEGCKYCKEDSGNELDKNCSRYYSQMNVSHLLAVDAFCNIINRNPHIKTSRKVLQELTVKFYNCLKFVKGKGIMYFDLEEITKHCLYSGLLSWSMIFSRSEPLRSLTVINNALNDLGNKEVEQKLFSKEDTEYIEIQKSFFKKEQEVNKERLFISEKSNSLISNSYKKTNQLNNKRPNRTDIAYYCYYSKETKTLETEKPFPSDNAWQEIGEKFGKNWKNIQQAYNPICNNENERLKKSKKRNLEYVIKKMLQDNEKAKKLAQRELNTLLLNS